MITAPMFIGLVGLMAFAIYGTAYLTDPNVRENTNQLGESIVAAAEDLHVEMKKRDSKQEKIIRRIEASTTINGDTAPSLGGLKCGFTCKAVGITMSAIFLFKLSTRGSHNEDGSNSYDVPRITEQLGKGSMPTSTSPPTPTRTAPPTSANTSGR